jgi:hypothetical protein
MLAFYPLNQLYYLSSHKIIPTSIPLSLSGSPTEKLSPSTRPAVLDLAPGRLTRLATRFWAVYVILQLVHLREDRALLMKRQRDLKKVRGPEHAELKLRWDAWYNELAVNSAFLPLTIHW